MNKPLFVIVICITLGTLAFALFELNSTAHPVAVSVAPVSPESPMAKRRFDSRDPALIPIQIRDAFLALRSESPLDLTALAIDPAPYINITDDSAVMQILALHRPPSVGNLVSTAQGRTALELDGKMRFEAVSIGETRSLAEDGTVAVDAITLPSPEDHGTVPRLREIWVIGKDLQAERLTPPDVQCSGPIISPCGRYVAFTGRHHTAGALSPKALMIKDRESGELSSYAEKRDNDAYEITPIDWVDGGSVLRVLEDWSKAGGRMSLKQVRLE